MANDKGNGQKAAKEQPAKAKAKAGPWIHVATRRIAQAPIVGAEDEMTVMRKLCERYPEDEWELKAVNFVGLEPNVVDVMFVFVARR